jgi:hypothetical protein
VGDKLSSNSFSDKFGKIWRDNFHSVLQITLNLGSEIEHFKSLVAEFTKTLYIEITDFLSHGILTALNDLFGNIGITTDLFNFFKSGSASLSVSHQMSQFNKNAVIRDNLGQFWEMP